MSSPSAGTTGQPSRAEVLHMIVEQLVRRPLPIAVRAWDGSVHGPTDAQVTVVVHSPMAVRHLLWAPGELGLVRAHVQGHLDIDGDVFDLLSLRTLLASPPEPEPADGEAAEGAGTESEGQLRIDDVSVQPTTAEWFRILRLARRLGAVGMRPPVPQEEARLGGRLGSVGRTSSAVRHHYDVGNDFYRLLLGPTLTYSCGYWARHDSTLEQAQEAKHELVCRKLGLRPGQRLLDVGCGWGSMVLHAVRHHGVKAVGVTLSEEQALLAMRRVREAGLEDSIDIRLQDYRDIEDGPFDAVSSIGMFEHVPRGRVTAYLGAVRELLRPGGRFLNHAISRPDPESSPEIDPHSFMGRYVFPDATLHEVGSVVTAMDACGLEVRDVQSLREHYAQTLRAWVANLEGSWDEVQRIVGPGRARVWRLYLAGSALGFEEYRTSVYQVLAVNTPVSGQSGMPATRFDLDLTQPKVVIDLRSGSHGAPATSADGNPRPRIRHGRHSGRDAQP